MFTQQNFFASSLFFFLGLQLCAVAEYSEVKFGAAKVIATETFKAFMAMFETCVGSSVPSEQFKVDNVKGFLNSPSRTTVGTAPKVTSNRKFFANLVSTRTFKEMLEKDIDAIRANFIKKMKYCDKIIMNENMVKDFYDREVDQTKI